jgi:hypothetical protein
MKIDVKDDIKETGISHNGFRPNNNQSKQGVTA